MWNARQVSKKLALEQKCAQFLAAKNTVSMVEIRSAAERWRLIDKLIEFKLPTSGGPQHVGAERRKSIEEDLSRYAIASRELKQMKEQIERVVVLEGRLTEHGKRKLFELTETCNEIKARISHTMDGLEDLELLRRISIEIDAIPGEQRALNAARSHGVYSFKHVSALLWQARMYGLVSNKTCRTSSLSQVLQKIQAHRYSSVSEVDKVKLLAYDDDSELLMAAGVMMLEVQRIIDDRQHPVPTDSEKATLRDLLVEYKYLLEGTVRGDVVEPSTNQARMQDTRSAFAYSWNVCQKLIDAK